MTNTTKYKTTWNVSTGGRCLVYIINLLSAVSYNEACWIQQHGANAGFAEIQKIKHDPSSQTRDIL